MRKKLTILFALLCVSVMGWAYDENASFPEAGSYANQFSWSSIGGVTPPMGVNSVESKSGFDCIYVNVGQADFDPSTGIEGCELAGYEGAGVWIKINSLILEDNEIYFKKSDGTKLRGLIIHNSAAGGGNLTPTLGEKFVAANASIAGTSFATGGKWTTDPGSNASYDAATGVISVHIDQEKIAQWQGQVKLALGFVYSAEKYYDFSIKFHASKAVNGVTLKSSNDNALFFENQSVNLSANEDYVWTKSDVAGVAGDNTFVFDFGLAAAGTDITISEISIIEKDEPSTPAVVETYCRKATGHLGQANFGDIYGRILLTIKKVNETTIAVRVEPNNNGTKGIKYLNIIVNGTSHEFGNNDGSGEDLTGFYEISGLASLDFTFNLSFYCNTPNWTTNQFNVTESELCTEESVILTEGSEYCEYGVACAHGDGDFAYLSWNTTVDGDVVISIVDGVNSTNARFRGNGFEGDFDAGFKVLSGANFSTEEVASKYFNRILPSGDKKSFTLQRKGGAVLPSPAKIRFSGPALAWLCDQHDDGYRFESFTYTYGKICPVVSGYAVSASSNNATMGSATATVNSKPVTHVDAGTPVTFTATTTDNTYTFVNWTKGGVEVSTNPIYELEINEATALVANFDYVRNTYCHSEVLTNNGKKLYLSVSKVADNTYKIRIDGSAEARINGRNNFNFVINNTNDYSNAAYDEVTKSGWKVSNEGNGYIENTFTANDYKALTFGSHYFAIGAQGGGEFILDNNFPLANTIAWNSTCSDTEAPAFNKAEAEVLNESSVRLKIQATDNWGGTITYNINYKPTGDNGTGIDVQATGASGEQITKDIEGLTTNKEYTFTITASDGVNVSAAQTCKATPAGDVNAPTNVTISAVALTNTIVRLTLSAADDYAGDITYNIAYDNAGTASTSAAQGTSTTLDITGLTADREYHFSVVATDAANNSSDAVNASAVRTFAANLALNRPCTAGHETGNAEEVKEKSNDGNKGSRWSSGGSAVHGDDISTSQDWWYVDLGAVYDIKNIRMFWEGARPSKYKFFTSNDAIAWTEVANLLASPSYSANASAVMDYLNDINADAQGRYVKVWGYEDTNNNWAYGISFWELEVYGTPAVDGVAPVISSFEASGASTTSVLLKATADDNFKGNLTYTFYCNDAAQGEPVVKAAGEEATMTVNGLTMGINYNFKVNVSDGTNNTMSDVVVGTPINDNQAPNHVTVTSEATDYSITLTLSATDNLGGMIYYTVTCGETVKNAEALSGEQVNVLFDGLDYNTPYAFSVVAKDGSENAAEAVAHNKSTLPATYPTSYAPAPAFAEASVRPVFSSAYNKDCNFPDWGGSAMVRETYGAKKATFDKAYLGIDGFGTIKLDADDELYLSVWTNENIQFRVVPIIHNADNTANLPERGAFTQTLTGGQWNVVRFTMSDFVLNDADVVVEPNENYDRIYQIKIDRAANQTFWLDNIYFRRRGALNETDNAEFIAANNNEGQDITIPRTFPLTTEWYTLCLPFDLSDEQLTEAFGAGYTLATLANSVDHGSLISLNFNFIHSFEAGKAYLLRPGTAVTENPVFEGVVVKNVNPEDVAATSPLMNFQGTYNTILLNSENQRFVGPENYLYSPAEGGTNMKAFRCFFTIPQNSPLNGAPGRPARIVFGEQTATGMESVQGDDVQSAKVLMDGQLFIIREGRTYNAQGILVK